MNLDDIHNATSSPGSQDGHTPCNLQDGHQTDLFGQAVALANHSQPPENKRAKQTNATYGLSGLTSSASTALQSFLESRLQQLLPMDGWMKSRLTWKRKDTPSGRQLSQLAVSVRPINGTDCGLWPSPKATDGTKDSRTLEGAKRELARGGQVGLGMAAALWATPQARDYRTGESHRYFDKKRTQNMNDAAAMAMWPTPTTRDHKDTGDLSESMTRKDGKSRLDCVPRIAFGIEDNSSNAQMEKKGSLNPQFVCWLMGFPEEWLNYAPSATPSCPKSRRRL